MHFYLLKQYYFINKFNPHHLKNLNKNIIIIYRNYNEKLNLNEIKKIANFCKISNRKFYLANNIKHAIKLDLDGVYLPSFNKEFSHNCYKLKTKFKIIGSAHNLKEYNIKILQKVSEIFISPVFKKKRNREIGIHGILKFKKFVKIPVIALGGVNKNAIKQISKFRLNGFAGINIFDKKKGP